MRRIFSYSFCVTAKIPPAMQLNLTHSNHGYLSVFMLFRILHLWDLEIERLKEQPKERTGS